MPEHYFYGFTIAILVGIIAHSSISLGFYFVVLLLVITGWLFLNGNKSFILAIIALGFVIGFSRGAFVEHHKVVALDAIVGYKSVLRGYIVAEPDRREKVIHYIFKPDDFDIKIRVTLRQQPALFYGDYVELHGNIAFPENFENEHGLTFDYISFLEKDDIRYVTFFPQVSIIEREEGNFVLYKLLLFKQWFVETLQFRLKEPHGSLAAGILIGSKQSLGEYYLDVFRKSGLIHIVVLSGYNVTIIADTIRRIFSFLPKSIGSCVSIFSIMIFAIFTGGGATTVRASVMAIIGILAIQYVRRYSVHRSLLLAAVVMSLHNPYIVLGDPGFQLSFVATLGLLYVSPWLERLLFFIPKTLQLRSILATTTATQISVLPLLILMTGEVSVVALLANALVLPVVAPAMALSALTVSLTWLGELGTPLYLLTHYALEYMLLISEYFGTRSYATIPLIL